MNVTLFDFFLSQWWQLFRITDILSYYLYLELESWVLYHIFCLYGAVSVIFRIHGVSWLLYNETQYFYLCGKYQTSSYFNSPSSSPTDVFVRSSFSKAHFTLLSSSLCIATVLQKKIWGGGFSFLKNIWNCCDSKETQDFTVGNLGTEDRVQQTFLTVYQWIWPRVDLCAQVKLMMWLSWAAPVRGKMKI